MKVLSLLEKEFDAEKSCYHLRMAFQADFLADGRTETFQTSILFKARRHLQVVIVYVGQDTQSLGNLSDSPKDYISDSDNGDDREVSELNPAFIKKDSPKKSRRKIPLPSQVKLMRRHPSRYGEVGSELRKEFEKFKTDVENSGGFQVGHYPKMEAAGISGTWICKYYDIDNKHIPASRLIELIHLSQLALCFYNMKNMKEDTKFYNVKCLGQ